MLHATTRHTREEDTVERSLSDRINISTRHTHTTLNRLILARLPLSLPPYTHDPSIYGCGLLHITSIYSTFEQLWTSILIPSQNQLDPRIHTLLSDLHLPELARTARLESDIRACTKDDAQTIQASLQQVATSGRVAQFIAHIRRSVESNPHVLVAYAWVLYMALFAGGRFLRVTLQAAGSQFWTGLNNVPVVEPRRQGSLRKKERRPSFDRARTELDGFHHKQIEGLRFFHFDGDHDGEDIKTEFKRRIACVDHVLTAKEKDDVVQEGQTIFEYMVDIVQELDQLFGTDNLPVGRLAKTGTTLESVTPNKLDAQEGSCIESVTSSPIAMSYKPNLGDAKSHSHSTGVMKLIQPFIFDSSKYALNIDTFSYSPSDTKTMMARPMFLKRRVAMHSISYILMLVAFSLLLFSLGFLQPSLVFALAKIPTI